MFYVGGRVERLCRELGLFRRARRPVLLHRPRPGPSPMGRCWHVSADCNAAAPRRKATQLPADGMVSVPQDGCGGRVTPGRAHALLWHVDRVRGRYSELRPHAPGAARRDGHVCRGSSGRRRPSACQRSQRSGSHRRQLRVMSGKPTTIGLLGSATPAIQGQCPPLGSGNRQPRELVKRNGVAMSTLRILGTALVLAFGSQPIQSARAAESAVVTPLMLKELADIPGKEMLMITVDYPPGAVDPVHRHDTHAFVYVLQGSIVMQVRGGKEVTLVPGQTFHEGPNDVHTVGRNASTTEPAKFIVILLKKEGVDVVLPAE